MIVALLCIFLLMFFAILDIMAPARICVPQTFEFDSFIYKDTWSSAINELELENIYDKYAVKIVEGKTVGHIPKEHSKHCSVALSQKKYSL